MGIMYIQVIEVDIGANNVWKYNILSISTGEALPYKIVIKSTYAQLYFVTINKETD